MAGGVAIAAGDAALAPRPNALGRALPAAWQTALLARARGLGPTALLADLFLAYPPDAEGLDPPRARRSYFLVEQTVGRYFRVRVLDAHRVPEGRCLLIGCHSGVLPWDAACLVPAICRHTGRFPRGVGDFLFGRVPAVERYLAARGVVIGRPGRLALRTESPIVPVAIVGAEETHFLVGDAPRLARLLGLPYVPIVLSPLPLPARLYIRFGEPIRLPVPPAAAADQEVVDRLNVRVRGALQSLIDDMRRRRGGVYCGSYDDEAGTGG